VTVRREHIERVSFNLRQKLYLNVRFHFVDRPLSLNLANGSSWPFAVFLQAVVQGPLPRLSGP